MKIGGFQKTSLLDYPDYVSAIIWTIGCNFRCPFCYNKNIVLGKIGPIPEEEILSYLKKRKGLLDGVVITGGEPFLQEDLTIFLQKVKKLNYLIKIDTNGTYPEKLKEIIEKQLVDYIAMDIKAPKNKYAKLADVPVNLKDINQSIELIQNIAPDYEFRTTFVPGLLKDEDILEIAKWLEGSKRFILQQFKSDVPLISSKLNNKSPHSKEDIKKIVKKITPFFEISTSRGN